MSRKISLLAVLATVIFSLALAALRLQTNDVTGVSELLDSDARCSAPCFLGIEPNVTTFDQAEITLSQSAWVDVVSRSQNQITWTWSGQQPALIDSDVDGSIWSVGAAAQFVWSVQIAARIPTYRVWLANGFPRAGLAARQSRGITHYFNYTYPGKGVVMVASIACPASMNDLLNAPVTLEWFGGWGIEGGSPDLDLNYGRQWRDDAAC